MGYWWRVVRTRLLLVDDDPMVGRSLERTLARRYEVRLADSVATAIQGAAEFEPQVVVTDYELGDAHGRNGEWLLHRLGLPGVMLTGHTVPGGPYAVLRKPVAPTVLCQVIDSLLASPQA